MIKGTLSTALLLLLNLPALSADKVEPGGYVDPWLGRDLRSEVDSASWKGNRQEPLELLEFRTLDLESPSIRSARLVNGRIVALLAENRKTIHFIDLKSETIRKTITSEQAVTTLIGHGNSLLAYLPATKTVILRDLRQLDKESTWTNGADLLAIGVGGGPTLNHIVVIDNGFNAWWLHPVDLEPKHGPLALSELEQHLHIGRLRSPFTPSTPLP